MPGHPNNLSVAERERIEDSAERFKSQVEQASGPRIEDFLSGEPELAEPLLRKLLTIEVQVRQQRGETPLPNDYLERFPEATDFIHQLCNLDMTVESQQEVDKDEGLEDTVDFDRHSTSDDVDNCDALSTLTASNHATVPKPSAEASRLPVISGYEVRGEIARGGMGRVLAAHDLTLDREVAIKVVLPTLSPEARTRFVTESKITARLPHPGIPPVHALGELADGSPFLAMKLVRGQTLADLLHERESPSYDLARWVGVFEQACQAVGFAHSQGILHRDLKPANVMVGAFGELHVMDWGLAKDTQRGNAPPLSNDSADTRFQPPASLPDVTAAGQVMGTPRYMAPEQARGEIVDARADVFALGAILAEILTGRPAFTGATAIEVLKMAAAGNVSEVFDRLDRCEVDRELITLARQCLAPDRTDRPVNGHAVAESVAAYRAGVENRLREAQAERAAADARAAEQRKRRQVWAIAATAVIAVLVAGGAGAGWQWHRAENALDRVIEEQGRTLVALDDLTASRDRNVSNLRQVTKKLFPDLLGKKQTLTASDRTFISGLLPMWQEVAAARGESPEAIKLRAEGHFSVAILQGNLGQHVEAERTLREAVTAYENLSRIVVDDPDSRQSAARAHSNLGNALESLGKLPEALKEMRSAQAIQSQIANKHPDNPSYLRDQARSHLNIGNLLSDLGQDLNGLDEYRAAENIFKRLMNDYPNDPNYASDLAAVHLNLGNLFRKLGRLSETVEQYRATVALYESLEGRHPDELEYRETFALVRSNFGGVLFEVGELQEAENEYRQALLVREALAAEFPSITKYRSELTQTHTNLAVLLAAAHQPLEAEEHYGRALDLLSGLREQSPDAPEYRSLLAATHDNLGLVLGAATRPDQKPAEAEKHHRAALILWDELRAEFPGIPAYRGEAADCHNHLGLLLFHVGRDKEAEDEYRLALEVREEMVAEFPDKIEHQLSLAGGCCNFGKLVMNRGELDEGLVWFNKAIALLEPRVQKESKDMRARQFLRNSYWSRAEAHDRLGKTDAATADWEVAMELSPDREQILLRGSRADSRARAGLAKQAVEDIDAIATLLPWPGSNRYKFACVYAIASDKAENAGQKQAYCDKAMDMLHQAVETGWKDAERTATDPDLTPLRERNDFKQLLDDLAS